MVSKLISLICQSSVSVLDNDNHLVWFMCRCPASLDEDDKENMQVDDQTTTVFVDGNNRVDLKVVVNRSSSQGQSWCTERWVQSDFQNQLF